MGFMGFADQTSRQRSCHLFVSAGFFPSILGCLFQNIRRHAELSSYLQRKDADPARPRSSHAKQLWVHSSWPHQITIARLRSQIRLAQYSVCRPQTRKIHRKANTGKAASDAEAEACHCSQSTSTVTTNDCHVSGFAKGQDGLA